MSKTTIYYYISPAGDIPVKKFIKYLTEQQQRKVTRVFFYIVEYGLITAIPHIKKLTGTPLWEIRILGQDNIRILYASILINSVVILHGFIKKSQKTQGRELEIALDRLKDWNNRNLPLDL